MGLIAGESEIVGGVSLVADGSTVVAATAGGGDLLLLETGGTDNLLLETGDNLLLE